MGHQLKEAIRKFICRNLVSSEKSEVIKRDENLFLLLINHELWNCSSSDDENFSKIRDSLTNINNLLVEPILVKSTLSLFDILLEYKKSKKKQPVEMMPPQIMHPVEMMPPQIMHPVEMPPQIMHQDNMPYIKFI